MLLYKCYFNSYNTCAQPIFYLPWLSILYSIDLSWEIEKSILGVSTSLLGIQKHQQHGVKKCQVHIPGSTMFVQYTHTMAPYLLVTIACGRKTNLTTYYNLFSTLYNESLLGEFFWVLQIGFGFNQLVMASSAIS